MVPHDSHVSLSTNVSLATLLYQLVVCHGQLLQLSL